MDVLNLTPESLDTQDTNSEIEGYDEHVEEIQNQYPEEDWRTPEQQKLDAEAEVQPDAPAPTEAQPTAETTQPTQPQQPEPPTIEDEKAAQKQAKHEARVNHLESREYDEFGEVNKDSIKIWDGRQLNQLENGEEVIEALKLYKDYNPEKENRLIELLNGLNLADQREAFEMIRSDPELTAILDYNGDGELTYNDFHDTTHMNDGAGMTDEEDAEATAAYLRGLEDPDLGSRARALWQGSPFGQNMALMVLLRRKGYFDPSWEEDTAQATSGAWFDIGANLMESVGSIGDVLQGKGWHENSTWDDDLLQHKNTQSLEFLVNNPIENTKWTKGIYQGTYWGTTAALTYLSAGTVGGAMKASSIAPIAGAGSILKGGLASGPGSILLDTVLPGHFADYQKDGMGMMRANGLITGVVDMMGGAGEVFTPEVANFIESPTFKKYDSVYTEGTLALGVGLIFKGLGWTIRGGSKWLQEGIQQKTGQLDNYITNFSNSTKPHSIHERLLNQDEALRRAGEQLSDIQAAGREQLKKAYEGSRNAFSRITDPNGSFYGGYSNGAKMLGQTWSKAKGSIRTVFNDLDEIAHTVGIRKAWQGTSGLFNQIDLAKAAKSGISETKLARWGKELIEDPKWKEQLKRMNPLAKRVTRREASDTALRGIQEVLGRDAGRLDPADYWGKEILDSRLDGASFETLSDFDKWKINNIEVANSVNKQLLLQLRDSAAASGEMVGKTDLFATDGVMRRIGDNLLVGLSHVKKTEFTHKLARQMLAENGGKMTPDLMVDLLAKTAENSKRLHSESQQGIETMLKMMMETNNDELAEAILDVFKVSNDIHNLKDFDAWMHQAIVGGKFNGKVATGDLIKGLQKVMVQSILSGPKTPLRALLGTTTNSYLNAINEAVGATIRAPFTGDVIARKAAVAKLKGMFELIPEGFEVFSRQWNANFRADIADISTRFTEAGSRNDDLWEAKRIFTETRGSAGEKAAFYINNITRNLTNNKLFSWSPRALAAVDDTFLHISVRARSKELGMRKALDEVGGNFRKLTPEILARAEDYHYQNLLDGNGNINLANDAWLEKNFKEITLTSPLKGQAAQLDKVFSDIPLIRPFYLFAKTGINGLNFSFKNTPLLGALHKESIAILKHAGDDFTELAEYGIKNSQDLAAARNLIYGRQAVGSAVTMTMAGLYMAGQMTGNGPADRQLRQQWINAGWKPNHLYIGDVGFDYRTLEPFNVIWSTIADIGDNIELMGSEWAEKRLQAVAFVVGRGLTGKTYMSGLDQMMQIAQMKPGAMDKGVANILNNSIPLAGMRNEFGKWINPHMKELNSDMWSSIRNRNQASEFLAGEGKLPEKSDLLNGKPINNWNIIGRSFNAVSPISLDIRNDTPGRRLLMDSNYDLKSTTFAYGGYSFVKDAHVRAHFQNAIGTVPITLGYKKFKNLEEALNHLATRKDVKNSLRKMQSDSQNPANWDLNPNTYPHNTLIDNIFEQARSKAWAKINQPEHPGYARVQALKSEKDGHTTKTRDNRSEILELSFPQQQIDQFPK